MLEGGVLAWNWTKSRRWMGNWQGIMSGGWLGKCDVLGNENVGREWDGGEHFWHGVGRGDDFCMGVVRGLDDGFRSKNRFVCKNGWTGIGGGFSAPIPCQFSPCSGRLMS